MSFKATLLGLSALALATAAQAGNLVQNGDFTLLSNGLGQMDGSVTTAKDWSTTGYNFVFAQADQSVTSIYGPLSLWDQANGGDNTWNGLAAAGGNFAALDGDFYTAAITQTVNGLQTGKTYTLTYDYAFGQQTGFSGDTNQNLTASVGSASVTSDTFAVPSHGFTGWQLGKLTFTADSTSEVLSFLAYGDQPVPPFALVSNVSILAVPEPATWAILTLGVFGVGAMARRRRGVRLATA